MREFHLSTLCEPIAYAWFLLYIDFNFTFYGSIWTITLNTEATMIDKHK